MAVVRSNAYGMGHDNDGGGGALSLSPINARQIIGDWFTFRGRATGADGGTV